ncbi:cation efflux protein [Trichoderma austrokoningii]
MAIRLSRKQRLLATIAISFSFFVAELIAGFYTHSLALVADAFHYLSDLIGFAVALVAVIISEHPTPPPQDLTFGWARATLLGAFFNGVFLLALGVSILVQAIERFINVTVVDQPKIVLIIGSIGLGLNLLVLSFLHEHDHDHGHGHSHAHEHEHDHDHNNGHKQETLREEDAATKRNNGKGPEPEARSVSTSSGHYEHRHVLVAPSRPGRDLGMFGVFIHVVGDAINNIGVIASALVVWKAHGEARYYADPAIGIFISVMIFLTAWPLTRNSGRILLQVAPGEIVLDDIKHDIEMIPGIESVHELHIWRLDQRKSIATAHVVVDGRTVKSFADKAKVIMECLHAYGIHSATLQPEVRPGQSGPQTLGTAVSVGPDTGVPTRRRPDDGSNCHMLCGSQCGGMRCCTPIHTS